ncbi:MAG TPA: GNAT family N-acetyltransferase [Thermoleophilaceae bacterium]|jgi:CelD/BcsL family acetyltransferase involved in cellulose biosynthesis
MLGKDPADHTLTVLGVWRPHVDEIVLGGDRETLDACASLADARFLTDDREWLERQCTCDWIIHAESHQLASQALLDTLRSLPRPAHPVRVSVPTAVVNREGNVSGPVRYDARLVRNLPWVDETGRTWEVDQPCFDLRGLWEDGYFAASNGTPRPLPVTETDLLNRVLFPSDFAARVVKRASPIVAAEPVQVAYRSRLQVPEPPLAVASGVDRLLEVEVENEGDWPWPAGSVRPGFRWLHPSGYPLGLEGTGDPLATVVRPRGSARIALPVAAPERTGQFVLELDLFHEGQRWFGCPLRIELNVEKVSRPGGAGGGGLAFDTVASLDEVADELDDLAERAGNLFGTSEWLSAWWRHYGRGELTLSAARSPSGELLAVLPLYVSGRRPLRTLRFVGHGIGDQCGPVCAPEHRAGTTRALAELVTGGGDFDLFIGDDLPAGGEWPGQLVYTTASPVLQLSGLDWERYLASLGRNMRYRIRTHGRRLEEEHEVAFREANDPVEVAGAMGELFALHEARWQGHSRALAGAGGRLHVDFAQRAAARRWLRLTVMELDGRPVAASYNFRFAGCEYDYQCGRDPAYDQSWVGMLLRCRAIRQAMEDGLREYRFLRGGEPYKYRLASDDPGVMTTGLARNTAAQATLAVMRRAQAMPRRMRHRLRPPLSSWPEARSAA